MSTPARGGLKSRRKAKRSECETVRLAREHGLKVMPVQPEAPTLDPCLLDLLLDGLTSIEAFALSRIAQLPYTEVRGALALDETERAQIMGAAQEVAAKHRKWINSEGQIPFFLVAMTAAEATKLDALLRANPEPPADAREARWQLLWGLVLVFLPLLVFGIFFVLGRLTKR